MKKWFHEHCFVSTQHIPADDKARFANVFANFVMKGFPKSYFPEWFYKKLSNCFGHIAHTDADGFYAHFFSSDEGKKEFIQQTLAYRDYLYNNPKETMADVEQTLIAWMYEEEIQ